MVTIDEKGMWVDGSLMISGFSIKEIDDDTNVEFGIAYVCDTSDGGITLTLPDDLVSAQEFYIIDKKKTFSVNPVTIDRNGNNINGVDEDYICDVVTQYKCKAVSDDNLEVI